MGKGDSVQDDFSDAPIMASDTPLFLKEKHIVYWLRCLRSPLPHHYTSNDSNRMTLAFFTISALDLLGVLYTRTTPTEREEYATWIYSCQHPKGGFRGFPGTDFGDKATPENAEWDPANIPATYFALSALCVLSDDLSRVKRKELLGWLTKMQREDGSFGETLGPGGRVEGGMDTRYGYCAMAIRWILRGEVEGVVDGVADVRTEQLVRCIQQSQTYDGGICEQPYDEAQAGFTYCAIGALFFLSRLPLPEGVKGAKFSAHNDPQQEVDATPAPGLSSFDTTVRWLIGRLTTSLDEEDLDEQYDDEADERQSVASTASTNEQNHEPRSADGTPASSIGTSPEKETSFTKIKSTPFSALSDRGEPQAILDDPDVSPWDPVTTLWVGVNGRPNKLADTCYIFWVCGSLTILNAVHLVTPTPIRRYLCEKTQHSIAGGFGKLPGDPPDMYHSYLGLAALALLDVGYDGEEGVLARDTSSSSSSVSSESDAEDEAEAQGVSRPSLAQERLVGESEDKHKPKSPQEAHADGPNGRTVRRSRLGDIKIQSVKDKDSHEEGAGEGGEVGDGGGVLRRLDPALCFSFRAKEWLEGLSWRRAIVGARGQKQPWERPKYPKKQQDWEWDD